MNKKGFTLVEIMVALGIIAVIVSLSLSTFVTLKQSEGLDKDTELVVEILEQARSQTLSSQNADQLYGVHFASSTVTLFSGSSFSALASGNQSFSFFSPDTVLSETLTGGGNDVIFNRLSGETYQNGAVVLSTSGISETRTVTIYKTGVVESQ